PPPVREAAPGEDAEAPLEKLREWCAGTLAELRALESNGDVAPGLPDCTASDPLERLQVLSEFLELAGWPGVVQRDPLGFLLKVFRAVTQRTIPTRENWLLRVLQAATAEVANLSFHVAKENGSGIVGGVIVPAALPVPPSAIILTSSAYTTGLLVG